MQKDKQKILPPRGRLPFLVLIIALAIGLFCFARSFIHAMLLGVFMAVVMSPIQDWIRRYICPPFRKKSKPRWLKFFHRATRFIYYLPIGPIRPWLRWMRRHWFTGKNNKFARLCDYFAGSSTEVVRSAIAKRRLYSTLLTIAIMLLGIGIPVKFFVNSAASQAIIMTEYCYDSVNNGALQRWAIKQIQKPQTRRTLDYLRQTSFGKHLEKLLSEPKIHQLLEQFLAPPEGGTVEAAEATEASEITANAPREETASTQNSSEIPQTDSSSSAMIDEKQDEEIELWSLALIDKLRPYLTTISTYSLSLLRTMPKKIFSAISTAGSIMFQAAIFITTLFFCLLKGKYLLKFMRRVSPLDEEDYDVLTERIANTSQTILWGSLCAVAVQGIFAMVGYHIVGLPATFLGLLSMFCAVIPFVGTALVWIPASIYLLINGDSYQALFLVIWGFLVVSNIDGLVRPWIMSKWKNSNLSFAILFFSLIGGLKTCGFPGLVYGPILACLFISALSIFTAKYRNPPANRAEDNQPSDDTCR